MNPKALFDMLLGGGRKAATYLGKGAARATKGGIGHKALDTGSLLLTGATRGEWKSRGLRNLANPWVASGALIGGSMIEGGIKNLRKGATEQERMLSAYEQEQEFRKQELAHRAKIQRLQRDMAENAARLAAVAPDVYNKVLAGRDLPPGAVVLGGQPRTDLLEELAMRMASGHYAQDTQDPLSELE